MFQDRQAQREAIYALATDMMARWETSARTILRARGVLVLLQPGRDLPHGHSRRAALQPPPPRRSGHGCSPAWSTPLKPRWRRQPR